VRLQMAGISPEYHAHTHAHTHAHSHTHLHLHPSQQAQQAQAQEAAAAAAGTAGFPLPGEWHHPDPDKLGKNCFQGITILCQALGLKSLPSSASACMLLEGLQFVYCKEWQQIIGQFGGLVIFYENVWRSFTAQNSHQYSNFFPHVCKFIIFPLMEWQSGKQFSLITCRKPSSVLESRSIEVFRHNFFAGGYADRTDIRFCVQTM